MGAAIRGQARPALTSAPSRPESTSDNNRYRTQIRPAAVRVRGEELGQSRVGGPVASGGKPSAFVVLTKRSWHHRKPLVSRAATS
jgi:hypothetical protein